MTNSYNSERIIIGITYYNSPWLLKSGDDIRIHTICRSLKFTNKVYVFNLSYMMGSDSVLKKDGIVYIVIPRRFYRSLTNVIKYKMNYDLSPLIKLTHYVDEILLAMKIRNVLEKYKKIYIFGSMTLLSYFLHLMGLKKRLRVIYDPLANYAQTLYLRSRSSFTELLKYGLYLVLHKLQLNHSDYVIYPSKIDLENAKRMFKQIKALLVPNPIPLCYKDINEYLCFRKKRKDYDKPYFILLAGSKNTANERAVEITIKLFNNIPSNRFRLLITGPWKEKGKLIRNQSIKILGTLPSTELKKILAIADYGLAPIFYHVAGSYLKTLAYIAAALDIITTPWGLIGVNRSLLKSRKIYIIHDINEYKDATIKAISSFNANSSIRAKHILTCKYTNKFLKENLRKTLRML